MKGEKKMEFGVTGRSKGYGLTDQGRSKGASPQNTGLNFAELAAVRFTEAASEPAGAKTTLTGSAPGQQAGAKRNQLYMGETYQERLDKITDKRAAAAFREAYAKKMAGSVDYVSVISQIFNTGNTGATNFEDGFPQYSVITHVGNADISPGNWQRNDFPFWKYFQKDTGADALNDWKPVGDNPPQTRGDLQRNYSSVGAGRIAVLIPESLQKKMDADPAYARQIVAKLREWKEDYDRWDNTVAASYGADVAAHQAGKSYVFDLDENGDVRNCTVTSSGGRITGPTKEEIERFEAEQERKWKLRIKYIQIMEESAHRKIQEYENLRFFQSWLSSYKSEKQSDILV